MRKVHQFAAAALAATLFALPGKAAEAPTPNLSFSFTNSTSATIGSISWAWNTGTAVYVDSLRTESDGNPSKAVTISDACHPGVGYGWPDEFSVMSYIKVTDAPDKGTVASFGDGCFLLKQNATTMRFGTAGTYVDATADNLSTGWHLVVAKRTASGLSIQIDDGTAVTGGTAITVGNGFQIGTRWTGPLTNTALQATNLYIDELAIYNHVLTDDEVAAVVEAYPAAVPPTYTADLSASAEATVNYSALPWDVGSAPGANARGIIKTPAAGITITMDQASSAFELLTVQGSGKLTFAAGSGVTGTALSTNELVVETDVDVSAITSSLGSVTVAADKTLTTGANTTITGVPTGTATSKVIVAGSTELTAVPNNVLAMTGIVEIEPTITLSGDGAKLSFNTAQTLTYSANVNAPRLVVGDSGSANATITQLGGTISLSSTATACDSTTASAILLGHWNTTTTYNVQGGTISAPNGALNLGWDGTTTLNVGAATGNAALVNVYALKSGERYNTASVTINPTGTLQVGAGGIGLGSHSNKSVTLAGGTLLATATTSANIAHANGLNVTAPSTVAAAPSATLTINKASGSAALSVGTADQTGSVVISDVSGYTGTATVAAGTLDLHGATFGETLPTFAVASGAALILPAGTEGAIAVPADATLTLVLSSAQLLTGYTTTVTSGSVAFRKVGTDGALAEIASEEGAIENGTFTPSLNTWSPTEESDGAYLWANTNNWSKLALPAAGDSVKISVPAAGATLTLGAAVTVANVSIAGEGTLTLAGEALTVSGEVLVAANTAAAKDKLLAGTIQIDAGKTLTVSTSTTFSNVDTFGSDNVLALPALTGTGTLVKEGEGDLGLFGRSAEPTIQVKAGTLHVRSNPTTAMKLAVEDGATVNFTAWATSFNNSLNTFSLKGGSAFILSNGFNNNSPRTIAGAMTIAEATDEKPVKIYGSAFGPVTLNMPISGTGTLEFANGGVFAGNGTYNCDNPVTVSGVISGDIKVKVTDQANAVVFSGTNTYSGGTDIASGATLQASGIGNLGSGGVLVNGNATLKLTSTANVSEANADYSAVTGTGTIHFSGTGYRTLPIGESAMFDSALALCNEQSDALVITRASAETTVGSLSGSGAFRVDWGNGERTLKILQTKNTTYSGDMIYNAYTERLAKVVVAGAEAAAEKTLTLSGATTVAKLLEIEATGSVNLTGSWAGAVTVAGKLAGTGTVSGTLSFNSGAALDVTAGALTAGTVAVADGVTVAVTLPEDAEADDIVLTCSSPADVAAKLTGAPEGLKFAANEAGTAVVLAAKPTIVIPKVDEVELSEASQAVLVAAAEAAGLTSVTAVTGKTTVNGAETALTAAQIDNVLALFNDVVTAEGTTLKVDYNFGIEAITPQYSATGALQTFLVKVAVEKADGTLASVADGVSVKLVDSEGVTIEDGYGFGFQDLDDDGKLEAYFAADPTATHTLIGRSFKVKATK